MSCILGGMADAGDNIARRQRERRQRHARS